MGGEGGEAVEEGSAASGCQGVGGGISHEFGVAAVGNNEAGVVGKEGGGEVVIDGEEEGVGEGAVFGPFPVSEEVSRAGLYLDACEAAVGAEGDDVGAAAIGEWDFVNGGPAELKAEAGSGAADHGGAFGCGRLSHGGTGEQYVHSRFVLIWGIIANWTSQFRRRRNCGGFVRVWGCIVGGDERGSGGPSGGADAAVACLLERGAPDRGAGACGAGEDFCGGGGGDARRAAGGRRWRGWWQGWGIRRGWFRSPLGQAKEDRGTAKHTKGTKFVG